MKSVSNYHEFKAFVISENRSFLLLYKHGKDSSDCAYSNLKEAVDQKNLKIAAANVDKVRDIHTHYNIDTVPTLLEFEMGILKNVVKGCQDKAFYSTILYNTVTTFDGLESNKAKQVIVYTTPSCTYCNAIKNYLSGQGIAYREIDVSRDERSAKEMVRRSGQQGVPQTLIDGRLVIGYDKKKLDKLLEIN